MMHFRQQDVNFTSFVSLYKLHRIIKVKSIIAGYTLIMFCLTKKDNFHTYILTLQIIPILDPRPTCIFTTIEPNANIKLKTTCFYGTWLHVKTRCHASRRYFYLRCTTSLRNVDNVKGFYVLYSTFMIIPISAMKLLK